MSICWCFLVTCDVKMFCAKTINFLSHFYKNLEAVFQEWKHKVAPKKFVVLRSLTFALFRLVFIWNLDVARKNTTFICECLPKKKIYLPSKWPIERRHLIVLLMKTSRENHSNNLKRCSWIYIEFELNGNALIKLKFNYFFLKLENINEHLRLHRHYYS